MSGPALIAVAAATLAITLPVVGAAVALDASARAAGAADAAALAAADAALGWIEADPCTIARTVVSEMNIALESCDVNLESGQVRIRVSVQTMFGRVAARSHAAPPVA